jgi:lipid A ethanolaminephosphotransferase
MPRTSCLFGADQTGVCLGEAAAAPRDRLRTTALMGLVALKIALLVLFLMLTNQGVADRFGGLWNRGHWPGLLVFGGVWAISLVAATVAAFLPALWMRLFWSVPIAVSTFFGVLALEVTKTHLTFYHVAFYWAERAHLGDAANFYFTWFVEAGAKTLLGCVAILLPPIIRLRAPRAMIFAPLAPIAIIAAVIAVGSGRGTKAFPEQFSGISMIGALAIIDPFGESANRLPVQLTPRHPAAARHIFLIVDESVRGDFLDLNERRGTTPFLRFQRAKIANFGYAVSGNNCSMFSNLVLRYGGIGERLAESVQTFPSIWSYAKAAGFRTVYIDAQKSGGRLQNGMTVIERNQIDRFEQPDHLPHAERDFVVAQRLREIAREPEPHFVYVNKGGAHFPFNGNYPPESAVFLPEMAAAEDATADRERLINSYKNTMRYNVDGFFRELLRGDLGDVAIIYTSDHGLNLLDQDSALTHCNSTAPHQLEGLVPLLALGGSAELQQGAQEAAVLNHHRASHFQIFPTLLEWLGFDRAETRAIYGSGLFEPIVEPSQAFSFGPIAIGAEIRWRSMPPDLREIVPSEPAGVPPGATSGPVAALTLGIG